MEIIYRLKNLFRWIPIIWKDKDWDHCYIYEILKFKLKNQAEHLNSSELSDFDREYERLQTIIKLMDRVQNEYYIDTFWNLKKHDKARKLLFKMLEENIEKYWD